ncbi:MAG: maleylpyruvate isomerase family mycothiol-dependent enzyme [Acidimicrobiales bacterium]
MSRTEDPTAWVAALRDSYERLAGAAGGLGAEELRGPSYDAEWTVAQVLSHLGSGAEIFGLVLDAALTGQDPPGRESLQAIWDTWNAKDAEAQRSDWRGADAGFVGRIELLGEDRLGALRLSFAGRELDATGLLRMRLFEHVLHTWDVAVTSDPSLPLAAGPVGLLVDSLGEVAARAGKGGRAQLAVLIRTTEPDRHLTLDVGETVRLAPAGGDSGEAELRLPSEALIRLVYGRLDPLHCPAGVAATGVDLDVLRAVFPGL